MAMLARSRFSSSLHIARFSGSPRSGLSRRMRGAALPVQAVGAMKGRRAAPGVIVSQPQRCPLVSWLLMPWVNAIAVRWVGSRQPASPKRSSAYLRTRVQTNLYASWTSTEGFGAHWDDHDTVIVQLDGAKRWRIYGTTRPYPLYRDIEDPGEAPTEPVADLVLWPGHALYMPRGVWHAVSADHGTRSRGART